MIDRLGLGIIAASLLGGAVAAQPATGGAVPAATMNAALSGAAPARPLSGAAPAPPLPGAAPAPPLPGAAPARPLSAPGYLAGRPPVDAVQLLPPPPAPGSAQEAADRATYAASAAGVGGPQWQAAMRQLNPAGADFMGQLSCVVGARLSMQATPATVAMIARAGVDFIRPMDTAKKFYKRPRPFTTDQGRACDPASADGVGAAMGFAYPSGHSGIGWLWALILADVAPANATAIRQFGVATGDLRLACRVHWLSDVAYGRQLGAAIYQRIAAEPEYQADLARARAEIAAAPPLVCKGS